MVKAVAYAAGSPDTANLLSIGAIADGTYGLNSRIDEVALYKCVLNDAERTWLYNGDTGRSYPDLSTPPPASTACTYGNAAHKHAVTSLSTVPTLAHDAHLPRTQVPGSADDVYCEYFER